MVNFTGSTHKVDLGKAGSNHGTASSPRTSTCVQSVRYLQK